MLSVNIHIQYGIYLVGYYTAPGYVFILKLQNVSCEIEDFVETCLCKLRGILPSRVLGFYVTSSRMLVGTKSDTCGTQGVYKHVAVDMYMQRVHRPVGLVLLARASSSQNRSKTFFFFF